MRIRLPRYSGRDYVVLGIIILPFTVVLNCIIFGGRYFTQWGIFLPTTIITGILFAIDFILCTAVAEFLKKRMPAESQTTRRLVVMIVCLFLLSGFFLLSIFHGYELISSLQYTYNEKGFIWAYMGMAIINIFLAMLMEGIASYNNLRDNLKETENLKKTFKQSQLLGLKSQVNPHFLFNSLNTLSSLIAEDEKEAEIFLNEMTKVYRYMLRGDDEQLVTLQTEMRFIQSYIHLLERRFGQSLQVEMNIKDNAHDKLIPPLSLQVLIENAFTQNTMSKSEPLLIRICSNGSAEVIVRNNRNPKKVSNAIDFEAGLDNLVTKYRLLNAAKVVIKEEEKQRSIFLPLLVKNGGAA